MKHQIFYLGKVCLLFLFLLSLSAFEVPCDDPDYGTGPYDCEAPLDHGLIVLIIGILLISYKKLSNNLKMLH